MKSYCYILPNETNSAIIQVHVVEARCRDEHIQTILQKRHVQRILLPIFRIKSKQHIVKVVSYKTIIPLGFVAVAAAALTTTSSNVPFFAVDYFSHGTDLKHWRWLVV